MNFNKAIIVGNVTRDPELRQTASGQSVASFSVATNSFFSDKSGERQQRTEFHNVVAWGRQAEVVSQFSKKGSLILVEGRLQTRTWQDNQGQNRRTTEIVCERVQLGPRGAGSDQSFPKDESQDKGGAEEVPEINLNEDEIKAEEVPF